MTVPPGEDVAVLFGVWDREGRVPEGAVLMRHLGSNCHRNTHGGYEVAAGSVLGEVGATPPVADLDPWRVTSVVEQTPGRRAGRAVYAVMAPRKGV